MGEQNRDQTTSQARSGNRWFVRGIGAIVVIGLVALAGFYLAPYGAGDRATVQKPDPGPEPVFVKPEPISLSDEELLEQCLAQLVAGKGDPECLDMIAPAAGGAPDPTGLQGLVDKLDRGKFTYNRITEMWRDKPETVVLKIALGAEAAPALAPTLSGERVAGDTPVTPEMSARLQGTAGLKVEALGPDRQRISDLAATAWRWTVTPVSDGQETLTLTVYVHMGDGEAYTYNTIDDVIGVRVSTWQRVQDVAAEIDPVWAVLVAVVSGLWGAYRWFRRRAWHNPD